MQADQAVLAAQQASRGELKSLAVGFCVSKCSYAFDSVFPGLMQRFRKQRPDVTIILREMCSPTQARALNESQIDVGFLQIPVSSEILASQCLLQEPLVLALPQDHPLANLPIVPLSALAQEKFISFPQHIYPSLHQEVVAACTQAGFRPNVVQEVDSSQLALSLVGTGMGITFAGAVPAGLPPPGVVYKSVQDLPIRLQLSVVWRRDNVSAVLDEFVDLAREMF